MNIYDAAHNLARVIKNSSEFKEYVEKQERVFSNPRTKEMVEDFRSKAIELQMAQMSGQNMDEGKVEELKKLEGVLMENPVIREFLMSEMKFGQIMNDIYKILGDAVDTR